MANALYTKGKEGLLDGSIIWTTGNIRAVLVAGSLYTPDLANDTYLSDIPTAARVATSSTIGGKTATGGIAFGASNTIMSVTGTESVSMIAIFNDTGNPATSRLLALYDTVDGLPFTPNGGDVEIAITLTGLFSLQ